MSNWMDFSLAFPPEPPLRQRRRISSGYTQGLADEIGDRLLMVDHTGGPSLELLRLRSELLACPGFESALRERVDRLGQFSHPSFAKVRAVENRVHGHGLTIVSTYAPGRRLSEGLTGLRGPMFAAWAIRQLVPALASLHEQGPGLAHGALSLERIVMTGAGRLIIVEHVLGSALDSLQLPASDLWTRFRIAVQPADGVPARLDQQGDVFQAGLVACALLLGRPITAEDYPHELGKRLDESADANGQLPLALRSWLRRALLLEGVPWASARDAETALDEMGLQEPAASAMEPREAPARPRVAATAGKSFSQSAPASASQRVSGPRAPVLAARARVGQRVPRLKIRWNVRAGSVLIGLAVVLAATTAWRVYVWSSAPQSTAPIAPAAQVDSAEPIARAVIDERPVRKSPAPVPVGAATRSAGISAPPGTPAPVTRPSALPAAPTGRSVGGIDRSEGADVAAAAAEGERGGVRVISPIELQLLDGGKLLGSSFDGPIIASAGEREFDLVNSALGYRAQRVISVRPGMVTSVAVSQPVGRLSIDAVPSAAVSINGRYVGETPLANVEVPIGNCEVVFRHPSLGERRRTAVVRFDEPAHVSADFR